MGFIKQMNAKAKHLGMSDTHFEDPHGLGNNVSTARDLLKLSHVAMKNPTFQQYVSTNRHPIAIRSTKGIVRNVTWNNTNKLLSQPYFDGIKTGHSNPANGCLLLSGTYNNKRLHVVVLGSSNEETRFTDAYNLFQWASRRLHQTD